MQPEPSCTTPIARPTEVFYRVTVILELGKHVLLSQPPVLSKKEQTQARPLPPTGNGKGLPSPNAGGMQQPHNHNRMQQPHNHNRGDEMASPLSPSHCPCTFSKSVRWLAGCFLPKSCTAADTHPRTERVHRLRSATTAIIASVSSTATKSCSALMLSHVKLRGPTTRTFSIHSVLSIACTAHATALKTTKTIKPSQSRA